MTYDGLDTASLAARLHTPGLLCLPEVTSTLDLAHELAREGAPAGTAILADEQRRGRGRQGRVWHSPKGVGIWLGYIARPAAPLESGVLGLRVGLALVDALATLGFEPRLKWPNDVMVSDRKAAGILCEARTDERGSWVAIGVGINVRGPLPDTIAATAVALSTVRPDVGRVAVLERFVPRLHALSGAPRLTENERRAFARCDWLRDRPLTEPIAGTARGIDPDGALLVETREGTQRVMGGSVRAA